MKPAPALTVGEIIEFLAPQLREPDWPPDVFAIVGTILQKSGAYVSVLEKWPPAADWPEKMQSLGQDWRASAIAGNGQPPQPVLKAWTTLLAGRDMTLGQLADDSKLCRACLQLLAASDEACHGVGVVGPKVSDDFDREAVSRLVTHGTLCKLVDKHRAAVFPKLHTPRSGLTLRSMSLHLSLFAPGDVEPRWYITPTKLQDDSLLVLVVPWPREVKPNQFQPVPGKDSALPTEYGYFRYKPLDLPGDFLDGLRNMLEEARAKCGMPVDLVVFPELSLTRKQYSQVEKIVCKEFAATLIGGTVDLSKLPAVNAWAMSFPSSTPLVDLPTQYKHHRWLVDRGQIEQYGLEAHLDPKRRWWEHSKIERRRLAFMAMRPWLTLSVLICEDLARLDPVGEILRAVGPNLVIALLLDGPQLRTRWPARYATVLADDPGTSVLTLTSLGMAVMSQPPGTTPQRVIALWKDALSGAAQEIRLPDTADAAVLNLSVERVEEWTADRRRDSAVAGFPKLIDVKFVSRGGPRAPRKPKPASSSVTPPVAPSSPKS